MLSRGLCAHSPTIVLYFFEKKRFRTLANTMKNIVITLASFCLATLISFYCSIYGFIEYGYICFILHPDMDSDRVRKHFLFLIKPICINTVFHTLSSVFFLFLKTTSDFCHILAEQPNFCQCLIAFSVIVSFRKSVPEVSASPWAGILCRIPPRQNHPHNIPAASGIHR